jgi:DNA-binding transcriptional regulator YbjK
MTTRRETLLDAAIAVLGLQGSRGFTHRAVDAAAAVPIGTTSNYFRTREALIDGVVSRFVDLERAAWAQIADAVAALSAEGLVAALTAFVHDAVGPHRTMTLARYAIFLEAAQQPALRERLAANAEQIRTWGSEWLRGVGSADPWRDTQLVLDQLDGLILHQLAFPDPTFDPSPRLTVLIDAVAHRGPV